MKLNIKRIYQKYHFSLLIGLLVIGVYGQTVLFDFSSHDDVELLVEKAVFLKDPANVLKAFTTDVVWGHQNIYYRPVLTLSFMADTLIGGTRPFIFHLGNILIHLLACWMFFVFLKRLSVGSGAALWAAMVFSIHPVLIQAVAWIPGRNDSLLTVFVLLSSVLYLDYWRKRSLKWIWLHIGTFFAALLTKETAIFLPALLVFLSILDRRHNEGFGGKRIVPPIIGWMTAGATYLFLRMNALSGSTVPVDARMNTLKESMVGFISYIGKIFLPVNLSGDPIPADLPVIYGVIGLTLFIAATTWLGIKNKRVFFFGLLWFLLFLIPTFLGNTTYANFAEHRLYLPLIGFAIMLLQLDPGRLGKVPVNVLRGVLISVLIFFLSIDLAYSRTFKNGLSHWKRTTRVSPHSYKARQMLGRTYLDRNKQNEALKEFSASFALFAKNPSIYTDLGYLYADMGEYDKAEHILQQGVENNPDNASLYNNLGFFYLKSGLYDKAENCLKAGILLNGGSIELHYNLGLVYNETAQWDSLEKEFKIIGELNSSNPDVSYYLGRSYYERGFYERAEEEFLRSLKNNAGSGEEYLYLGYIYLRNGDLEKAEYFLSIAAKYFPADTLLFLNMSNIYLMEKNKSDAIKYYEKAISSGMHSRPEFEKQIRRLDGK
jgi:tetratricopeptide (TPR) repeat protein